MSPAVVRSEQRRARARRRAIIADRRLQRRQARGATPTPAAGRRSWQSKLAVEAR